MDLKKRFANLLTVKSIVTVTLTAVFSALALRGTISGTEFPDHLHGGHRFLLRHSAGIGGQ